MTNEWKLLVIGPVVTDESADDSQRTRYLFPPFCAAFDAFVIPDIQVLGLKPGQVLSYGSGVNMRVADKNVGFVTFVGWARTRRSIRLWRDSCSSIWSRKPIPVSTS